MDGRGAAILRQGQTGEEVNVARRSLGVKCPIKLESRTQSCTHTLARAWLVLRQAHSPRSLPQPSPAIPALTHSSPSTTKRHEFRQRRFLPPFPPHGSNGNLNFTELPRDQGANRPEAPSSGPPVCLGLGAWLWRPKRT